MNIPVILSKNIFFWFSIYLPPLFLLPLFFMPIDIITLVFWLLGGIAAIFSALSLANTAIRFFFMTANNTSTKRDVTINLIRPGLTILIFSLAFVSVRVSDVIADRFAMQTAMAVQKVCETQFRCPLQIQGWDCHARTGNDMDMYCSTVFGRFISKHIIYYQCSSDSQEFVLTVKHNIDEALDISGGVNKNLISKSWRAK